MTAILNTIAIPDEFSLLIIFEENGLSYVGYVNIRLQGLGAFHVTFT